MRFELSRRRLAATSPQQPQGPPSSPCCHGAAARAMSLAVSTNCASALHPTPAEACSTAREQVAAGDCHQDIHLRGFRRERDVSRPAAASALPEPRVASDGRGRCRHVRARAVTALLRHAGSSAFLASRRRPTTCSSQSRNRFGLDGVFVSSLERRPRTRRNERTRRSPVYVAAS